jgi:hypothetical protein
MRFPLIIRITFMIPEIGYGKLYFGSIALCKAPEACPHAPPVKNYIFRIRLRV